MSFLSYAIIVLAIVAAVVIIFGICFPNAGYVTSGIYSGASILLLCAVIFKNYAFFSALLILSLILLGFYSVGSIMHSYLAYRFSERVVSYKKINISFSHKEWIQYAKNILFHDNKFENTSICILAKELHDGIERSNLYIDPDDPRVSSSNLARDAFLVFHGANCAAPIMYDLGYEIANDFMCDVYIPTLPNHAGTVNDLENVDMLKIREFVVDQINYLAGKYSSGSLIVMGWSLGGLTIADYFINENSSFPSNAKIILCAPAISTRATFPVLLAARFTSGVGARYIDVFLSWAYKFASHDPDGANDSYYTCFNLVPTVFMLNVVERGNTVNDQIKKFKANNKVPTLSDNDRICILFGDDEDVYNPGIAAALEGIFPITIIPGLTHTPFGKIDIDKISSGIYDAIVQLNS